MSEGPIKREREAGRPTAIPPAPKLGDLRTVDQAPDPHSHWRVIAVPSTALGPHDLITLESTRDGRRIRRFVHQTHAIAKKPAT